MVDFDSAMITNTTPLPEEFWGKKRRGNAKEISERIRKASAAEIEAIFNHITNEDEGRNNFIVSCIMWTMPEETAGDSFKLGWDCCFLNEAAAERWEGFIMSQIETKLDSGFEVLDEDWKFIMVTHKEQRTQNKSGFRIRSGLEMAYFIYLGFLLLKTGDQDHGLGVKEIIDLLYGKNRDQQKFEKLKKNVTSKDAECLKQFFRRKFWQQDQFTNFVFGEEAPAHPTRPSSSGSGTSGKQYFGSGSSRVAPAPKPSVPVTNGIPNSHPAGQQQDTTQQRAAPMSGNQTIRENVAFGGLPPEIREAHLRQNVPQAEEVSAHSSRPASSGSSGTQYSGPRSAPNRPVAQENQQRHPATDFSVSSNRFGPQTAGHQVRANQQNVPQTSASGPHLHGNIMGGTLPQQIQRYPGQGVPGHQNPYQQALFQNQGHAFQNRPTHYEQTVLLQLQQQLQNSNQQILRQVPQMNHQSQRTNQIYNPILPPQQANIAQQQQAYRAPAPSTNVPNPRPIQISRDPPSLAPQVSTHQAHRPQVQTPPTHRAPPVRSPQSQARVNPASQAPLFPLARPTQPIPTIRAQNIANSPHRAQQQPRHVNLPRPQSRPVIQRQQGPSMNNLRAALPNEQNNNNNPRNALQINVPRVLPLPTTLPDRMSLPYLRLSPDLPENGAMWCEKTAIWIMMQPEYIRLGHGCFILVQITRSEPADLRNEWLLVRARLMRVPNCGDCPHARLYARTTQPEDDCIPHQIELQNVPGAEPWTIHWKRKGKKMKPANEELPCTSDKDPPGSFNLPVPQKSDDDDDDDFHVQNTPMANRHESSDEEELPMSAPRVEPVIPPVQNTALNVTERVPIVSPAPTKASAPVSRPTPSTSSAAESNLPSTSSLPNKNARIADLAHRLLAANPKIKTPSPPKEKSKQPAVDLLPEIKKEAPTPRKTKPDDSDKKNNPLPKKTSDDVLQSEAPVASTSTSASQDLPVRKRSRLSNSRMRKSPRKRVTRSPGTTPRAPKKEKSYNELKREETMRRIEATYKEVLKMPILEPEDGSESSSDDEKIPIPNYDEIMRGIRIANGASTGAESSSLSMFYSNAENEAEAEPMQIDPPSLESVPSLLPEGSISPPPERPAPPIEPTVLPQIKPIAAKKETDESFRKIMNDSKKRIERGSTRERKVKERFGKRRARQLRLRSFCEETDKIDEDYDTDSESSGESYSQYIQNLKDRDEALAMQKANISREINKPENRPSTSGTSSRETKDAKNAANTLPSPMTTTEISANARHGRPFQKSKQSSQVTFKTPESASKVRKNIKTEVVTPLRQPEREEEEKLPLYTDFLDESELEESSQDEHGRNANKSTVEPPTVETCQIARELSITNSPPKNSSAVDSRSEELLPEFEDVPNALESTVSTKEVTEDKHRNAPSEKKSLGIFFFLNSDKKVDKDKVNDNSVPSTSAFSLDRGLINEINGRNTNSKVSHPTEKREKQQEEKKTAPGVQEPDVIDLCSSDDESPPPDNLKEEATEQTKEEFIPSEDREISGEDAPEEPEDDEDDSVEFISATGPPTEKVLTPEERAPRIQRIRGRLEEMKLEGMTEYVEKQEELLSGLLENIENAEHFDQIDEMHEAELKDFKKAKLSAHNAQKSSEPVSEIQPTDEKSTAPPILEIPGDQNVSSSDSSDDESVEQTVAPAKHDKSFPMRFCYPEHDFKNEEQVLYFDKGKKGHYHWFKGYYHSSLASASIFALHKNVTLKYGIKQIYERSSKIKKVALVCPSEKNKDWAVVGVKDVVCDNDETTAIVENQPIVLPIVKQEPKDFPRPEPVSHRVWTEGEGENGEKFISLVSSDEEEETWDADCGSTEASAPQPQPQPTLPITSHESRKRPGSVGSASDAPVPKQLKTSHEIESFSAQENDALPNSQAVQAQPPQSQVAILEPKLPVENTTKADTDLGKIDYIKLMRNSASKKSPDSTLETRRAHSSNSNDKELFGNVSDKDVQGLETFHVGTEVDTSGMTEQELERHEEKVDEIYERRELTHQRVDSLNLEILHLRGAHEVHDEKLRALEKCKETKNTAVVQVVRRDRNKVRSRKNMSENERDACEMKLAPIHTVANSELVNGLEHKTRAETPARIGNQLTPVTKELEDMGSWFNQRTSLALKPRKEEKKTNTLLHTRPGFTEDIETTPVDDDKNEENDEWDIIDSLEIPELEMPSTSASLSLPLLDESVLAKTISSINPQKKLAASEDHPRPSDPRKRPQPAPEVTVTAKKAATPSKRENNAPQRPTDPRKRPKLAIPVAIDDQDEKSIEVKIAKDVRKIFDIQEFLSDMPKF